MTWKQFTISAAIVALFIATAVFVHEFLLPHLSNEIDKHTILQLEFVVFAFIIVALFFDKIAKWFKLFPGQGSRTKPHATSFRDVTLVFYALSGSLGIYYVFSRLIGS